MKRLSVIALVGLMVGCQSMFGADNEDYSHWVNVRSAKGKGGVAEVSSAASFEEAKWLIVNAVYPGADADNYNFINQGVAVTAATYDQFLKDLPGLAVVHVVPHRASRAATAATGRAVGATLGADIGFMVVGWSGAAIRMNVDRGETAAMIVDKAVARAKEYGILPADYPASLCEFRAWTSHTVADPDRREVVLRPGNEDAYLRAASMESVSLLHCPRDYSVGVDAGSGGGAGGEATAAAAPTRVSYVDARADVGEFGDRHEVVIPGDMSSLQEVATILRDESAGRGKRLANSRGHWVVVRNTSGEAVGQLEPGALVPLGALEDEYLDDIRSGQLQLTTIKAEGELLDRLLTYLTRDKIAH